MTDIPQVLFVCVHNAGRSQMAAGYLRALSGGAVEVRSAGSMPAGTLIARSRWRSPVDAATPVDPATPVDAVTPP